MKNIKFETAFEGTKPIKDDESLSLEQLNEQLIVRQAINVEDVPNELCFFITQKNGTQTNIKFFAINSLPVELQNLVRSAVEGNRSHFDVYLNLLIKAWDNARGNKNYLENTNHSADSVADTDPCPPVTDGNVNLNLYQHI